MIFFIAMKCKHLLNLS